MPSFREVIRYLLSRQTFFTGALLLLYAVTIQYCAQVGADDVNRYERFDSDERIPFESQLGARFANVSVYDPVGAHAPFSTPFAGSLVRVRILTLSAGDGDALDMPAGVTHTRLAPPARHAMAEKAPVVLLFNDSLTSKMHREMASVSSDNATIENTLHTRVCRAVKQVRDDFAVTSSALPLIVPLTTSAEVRNAVHVCAALPEDAQSTSFVLAEADVVMTLVPDWSVWLTEVWHTNRTTTSAPTTLRVGLLVFAEPAQAIMLPSTLLASSGKACGAMLSAEPDTHALSLERVCAVTSNTTAAQLACCVTFTHAVSTAAKQHYQVSSLHGVLPDSTALIDYGLHWMPVLTNTSAYLLSLIPRTPIALLTRALG